MGPPPSVRCFLGGGSLISVKMSPVSHFFSRYTACLGQNCFSLDNILTIFTNMSRLGWSMLNFAILTLALFILQHELREILTNVDRSCSLAQTLVMEVHSSELVRTHSDFICFKNVTFFTKDTLSVRDDVIIGFEGAQSFITALVWVCRIVSFIMLITGFITLAHLVTIILDSFT